MLLLLLLSCLGSSLQDLQDSLAQPANGTQVAVATISVTANGEASSLSQLAGESALQASQRWVAASPFAEQPDVDSILRLLVHRLRREGGAGDGLPVTTEGGRRTLASVRVRGRSSDGALGPARIVRWLEGESAGEAAAGFVERTGLPAGPNVALLEAALASRAAAGEGGEGGEEEVAAPLVDEAAALPAPPPIPPSQGFALRVAFKEAGRAPAHLVYRYGEDAHSAVAAFLDEQGVREEGARSEATAALTEALVQRASAALRAEEVGLGGGGGGGSGSGEGARSARDRAAPSDMVLPLSVGELGFDISLPQGTSLWAAARVFCEQHWDVLAPAMGAAVEQLFGGLAGGAPEGSGGRAVSLDTCRAVVFDLMLELAGAAPTGQA